MGPKFTPSDLPGIFLVELSVVRDGRGFFSESYRQSVYRDAGLPDFVQDNRVRSAPNTLRGLHAQWRRPQAKLIQVLAGEIFDVAVDIRQGSPTFLRWIGTRLRADEFRQLYVPTGFAHGYYVVGDGDAEVSYRCSDYYDPGGELCIRWDDPAIGIHWPTRDPLLSTRDRAAAAVMEQSTLLPLFSATERSRPPA